MASNRFDIRLLGSEQLSRDLAALPDKLERKILTKALRAAGKFYLNLAKARVPRDEGPLGFDVASAGTEKEKGQGWRGNSGWLTV